MKNSTHYSHFSFVFHWGLVTVDFIHILQVDPAGRILPSAMQWSKSDKHKDLYHMNAEEPIAQHNRVYILWDIFNGI